MRCHYVWTRRNGAPVRLARVACGAGAHLGCECGHAACGSDLAGNNLNRFDSHGNGMVIAFDGPGNLDGYSVVRVDQHAYRIGIRLSSPVAVAARITQIATPAQRVWLDFRVRSRSAVARVQVAERRSRRHQIAQRQRRNE